MKKNRKNGEIRLCNVIFPLWMIFLISPYFWMIALIGNFLIDSAVIVLALPSSGIRKSSQKRQIWKQSILRVFLIGFLSDFTGALIVTVVSFVVDLYVFPVFLTASPVQLPGLLVYAIPGILLSGWMIYRLNRRFAFQKCRDLLSDSQIHRLALLLAWITAPYFMLIPLF